MKVESIWETESGEIYVRYENGEGGQVLAGWWHGCENCGAYEDQIQEVMSKYGVLEACKSALEHLGDGLCSECAEETE
ncbi:MAG: hypothetical protein ACLFRO_05060 [Desulfobacterales bacterium]